MRNDPYAQFNFRVEIDGIEVAGFTEVGGLMAESDVIEYREGTDLPTMRKIPGLLKYGNISLKRGYVLREEFWKWRQTTEQGKTERHDGSITLMSEDRSPVMRWVFRNSWISKYEGPALNSTSNEVAVEAVEMVCESLEFELV